MTASKFLTKHIPSNLLHRKSFISSQHSPGSSQDFTESPTVLTATTLSPRPIWLRQRPRKRSLSLPTGRVTRKRCMRKISAMTAHTYCGLRNGKQKGREKYNSLCSFRWSKQFLNCDDVINSNRGLGRRLSWRTPRIARCRWAGCWPRGRLCRLQWEKRKLMNNKAIWKRLERASVLTPNRWNGPDLTSGQFLKCRLWTIGITERHCQSHTWVLWIVFLKVATSVYNLLGLNGSCSSANQPTNQWELARKHYTKPSEWLIGSVAV